jgi:signal transduction histidine kinase
MDLGFRQDNLALGVADDGCGFDPDALSPDLMCFGLIGMRERVAKLGGTLELKSVPAIGTNLTVLIPRNPKPRTAIASEP